VFIFSGRFKELNMSSWNFFKRQTYTFTEVVITSSFLVSFLLLFFGALGLFNKLTVILTVAVVIVFFLLSKKDISKPEYWWLFILVPVATLGFMFLRGFFSGDVYYHWLPFAKEIASTGAFPDFVNLNWFSVMPLQSLLFAGTFVLLGTFNDFVNLWVPLFFTASTLLVLLEWGKYKEIDKKYWIFLGMLFLTNAGLQTFGGWNLMQDPLVLFFATCFFYYYDRFGAERISRNLVFALLSLVLAALAKFNGVFLLIFLIPLFFKSKNKLFFFKSVIIFSIPLLYWFIRNYVIYGNPVFPIMNTFFGGPYAESYSQFFEYAHHLFTPYPTVLSRLKFIIFALIEEFPYIFLAVYGLVKKRAWMVLAVFAAFFLSKELFLFSSTSGVRYYYLFFGLFLIYALFGLQQIKSRLALGGLVALAFYQLFAVFPVDSTSLFISKFENLFSPLFTVAIFFHDYRLFWALGLGVIAAGIKDGEKVKIVLLYLYGLFVLKIKFVANKSWLNTWPAIASGLVYFAASLVKVFKLYMTKIAIVMIAIVLFVNSWLLGATYYINQGNLEFPVKHIWGNSIWVKSILDARVGEEDRKDFYILIFSNRGYFMWFTDYQVVTYSDFDFHELTGSYKKTMTAQETKELFIKSKIKYILINELDNDTDYTDFGIFADLVSDSGVFDLIEKSPEGYSVWKVF